MIFHITYFKLIIMIEIKILVIATLALSIKSDCLSKDNLKLLRFTPLEAPEMVENPSVCKSVFAKYKSCVKMEDLEKFLEDFQKDLNDYREDGYEDLEDKIEQIIEKYQSLKDKIDETNTYKDKPISSATKIALNEVYDFLPSDTTDIGKKVDAATNTCIKTQNQLSIGAFCLLASSGASDYVDHQAKLDQGIDVQAQAKRRLGLVVPSLSTPLNVKVDQHNADVVLASCMPIIRSACIYNKMGEALDSLENKEVVQTRGCYKELMACDNNLGGCSGKAKHYALENFFSPYKDLLVNEARLDEV